MNELLIDELNINDFVDYIYHDNIEDDKKIIYISIGSAHHMARVINGELTIEIQYDQQYPMFLRNIRKKHPDHNIYIVLVDPMLEIPNYTVTRKIKDGVTNPLDDMWDKDERYKNIYHHLTDNVHILEFKNMIKYGNADYGWAGENIIDINDQISGLINIAMANKWFVIVMEYTGRNLNGLASHYDKIIDKEKDHIFFGLPTRIEGGCYINLEDTVNNYVTNLKKGYLTAFTPFNYTDAEIFDIHRIHKELEDIESKIITDQIKITFTTVVQTYKTNVLALYRRLNTHKLEKSVGKSGCVFWDREFSYVTNKYNIENFKEKIDSDLNGLIETLSNINDREIQYILNFFGKQEFYPKYLENKHNPDPFKMYAGINAILNDLCPE
jgi:hypothetical protein